MKDINELIKVGQVSEVNVEKRTARVAFGDKDNLVSAELHVLINHPLITVDKTDNGASWGGAGAYNSEARPLQSTNYKKSLPDTIDKSKVITYQGEQHTHTLHMEVHPWLPYVGQWVVCIFAPEGGGDGFVIGGF